MHPTFTGPFSRHRISSALCKGGRGFVDSVILSGKLLGSEGSITDLYYTETRSRSAQT